MNVMQFFLGAEPRHDDKRVVQQTTQYAGQQGLIFCVAQSGSPNILDRVPARNSLH